jgi:hypothetical protein
MKGSFSKRLIEKGLAAKTARPFLFICRRSAVTGHLPGTRRLAKKQEGEERSPENIVMADPILRKIDDLGTSAVQPARISHLATVAGHVTLQNEGVRQ